MAGGRAKEQGKSSASAASEGGAEGRPCQLCAQPVDQTAEEWIEGICSVCGSSPYHVDCVQEVRARRRVTIGSLAGAASCASHAARRSSSLPLSLSHYTQPMLLDGLD